MTQKSPFSLFYNNFASASKAESNRFHFQDPAEFQKNQFNFQTNLPHEKYNKSGKRQTKIKVFGLTDKKRGKEDKLKDLSISQNQAKKAAQKVQEDFNLLESKTFQRHQPAQGSKKSIDSKEQQTNQLHKLLGLCDQMSPLKKHSKFDQNVVSQLSIAQKHQQGRSKLKQQRCQNIIPESMLSPSQRTINFSSKGSQKVDKNEISSRKQVFFDKSDSRFLPSELAKKQMTPFESKVHSRIIDLIAQMVQNTKTPLNNAILENSVASSKNSNILVCDRGRLSKNTSALNLAVTNSKVNPINQELIKAKSCQKYFPAQKSKLYQQNLKKLKQLQTNSRPNIPLPKKPGKKNETKLGEYLNHYGSYEKQIQNLVDRYQKVKELKQRQIEIKQQLNNLEQKQYQSNNIHASIKDYYFPEQSESLEKSRSSINLYYTNQFHNALHNRSQLKSHNKHMSYDSNPVTESPNPHQNDLQRQLNREVASMQKMLKKFKKIAKNINVASQNSLMLQTQSRQIQTNRRSLLQDQYFKANYGSRPSNSEFQQIKTSTKKSQNIRRMNLPVMQADLCQSSNMGNSVEMTENNRKQATLQQFYSIRVPDKRTSRTQKKYPKNFSSQKPTQNKNQECKYTHELLLKQIKRLNDKVASLTIQKKLQNAGSQIIEIQTKNSIQVQSDQQPSVNVSIPPQNGQDSSKFHQINESYQFLRSGKQYDNEYNIGDKCKTSKNKRESKEKTYQKQKKKKLQSQQDDKFKQRSKKNAINFPIFYSFPSEKDNLSQLVQIGSYMFRLLYKFAISRKNRKMKQLTENSDFKVKRYPNLIHYSTHNELNYHLVYYFKGSIYFGQWLTETQGLGYRNGQGYYFHPHKYVYQGQFVLDRKQGYGIAQYTNGQFYEGQWKKNKKQGKGVLINVVGDYYKGNFKGGKKHGKGQEQLSNGDYYKGYFKSGKIEGKGKYVWSDGSIYKGQFKDGKLNGNGTWKSKQNDVYQGNFKDNKKEGEGVYKWSNGIMYAGYFLQEKKQELALQPEERIKGGKVKKTESSPPKRSKTKDRKKGY